MNRRLVLRRALAFGLLGLLLPTGAALAHGSHEHAAQAGADSEVRFVEAALLDQHGQPVHLRDDLVSRRIVVMSFVYTSCTTVCPVISAIMDQVQQQLGERVGPEVQLISITLDPQRDTPQRLRDYAARFHPNPGWRWLTGSPRAVGETLKALGAWSADYENHPPLIMVGDGDSQRWTRFYGFTEPRLLLARVEALSAARSGKGAAELAGVRP